MEDLESAITDARADLMIKKSEQEQLVQKYEKFCKVFGDIYIEMKYGRLRENMSKEEMVKMEDEYGKCFMKFIKRKREAKEERKREEEEERNRE